MLRHDDVIKWKHFLRYWSFFEGNPPVTDGLPSQRQVTRSFDIFFDLRLNKQLIKLSGHWWFETPLRSLWRHCNGKILGKLVTMEQNVSIYTLMNWDITGFSEVLLKMIKNDSCEVWGNWWPYIHPWILNEGAIQLLIIWGPKTDTASFRIGHGWRIKYIVFYWI